MALLSIIVFVYNLLFGSFRIKRIMLFVPLFALFALIGTLLFSKEYRAWISLILLTISFFIFVYAFKIIGNKIVILNIITIAFFLFSLYFILYFRNSLMHFNSETRLGPPFDNQNGVAAYAVVGFSVPLYLVLFYKRKIRFIYIIPCLTSLVVGVSTGSRTFFVIVFIFFLVFLFFKFKKHKFIYFCVVGGLIVLGIIFLNLPFMSSFKQRIIVAVQTLIGTAEKVDTSTLERFVYVDYGFYLGSKNLLLGYGVGGYSIFSGVGTYAHSNFAEVLCNFGIVGFLLFYTPLVILLFRALTNTKIDKAFVISFFAYYFIVSISNVLYYKKIYYLVLALLVYLVYFDDSLKKNVPVVNDIKTIVFTCDSMESGGAERVIANLANEMALNNISVTIIGVSSIDDTKSFYHLNDGVSYLTLANGSHERIHFLKRLILLRKVIKNIHPDVVIAFLPHVIIYTVFALLFSGIPCVVSERNNPYIDPKGFFLKWLRNVSFGLATGCVFQTKEAMQYYSYKVGQKSTIIKNPITLFANPRTKTNPVDNVVLSVGRLTPQKNFKCLIKAFSIFNNKCKNNYLLRIYGEGPLKDDLINYCTELNVLESVDFRGNCLNWHEKEVNDTMFVLSSDYEGMPNALAEAMALGIPSISTDCPTGGSRELINDGTNGYLVPTNDPIALSEKMIILAKQKSSIFFDSTRVLIDDYSVSAITSQWLSYIKGLSKTVYE